MALEITTMTHAERCDVMRAAITATRTAALSLVDADLFGASDLLKHTLFELERQLRDFEATSEADRRSAVRPPQFAPVRRLGRHRGIDVVPGRVRAARNEAGLSLAELAGKDITKVAIWYIEQGRTRPSARTLDLIAERTRKPVSYFTGVGS